MKILVVDDSQLARMAILKALMALKPDVQVVEGENGAEAVELYQLHLPDAVFLDLTMPVMSGMEALEKILILDPNAKIIIITADIQKKANDKVIRTGAKMLVEKPINQEKMQMILDSL